MADFGTDLAGVADIDPTGAVVTGTRAVGEAIARRLSTPRGRVIDDPNYGTDLTQFVNDDIGTRTLSELQASAIAEALKDERVLTCRCTATLSRVGVLSVQVSYTTADGPFALVLSVSQTSVQVLSVT